MWSGCGSGGAMVEDSRTSLNKLRCSNNEVHHWGKLIELHGDREKGIEPVSPSQLRRFVHTNPTTTFFHIRVETATTHNSSPNHPLPAINTLISKYTSLFQPPATLPPSRSTDHTINLLPNSTPVNVRPYRYPYF